MLGGSLSFTETPSNPLRAPCIGFIGSCMRMTTHSVNSGRRYELIPQARVYDDLRFQWVPHLMYTNPQSYRSDVCNTDEHGFRLTYKGGLALDFDGFQQAAGPKALLCGASTVFGVGASSDAATIASVLNRDCAETWFNFGALAHTSTQELLMYLLFRPKADRVVILSGINNLTIHTWSPFYSSVYGSIFGQSLFQILNRIGSHREYLQYLSSRVLDQVKQRLRRALPFSSPVAAAGAAIDQEERYRSSLAILSRDLDTWAVLRDQLGFSLTFILQPISVWMNKNHSPEEEELIGQLDAAGRRQWGEAGSPIQKYLTDVYPRYRDDVQRICQTREIQWMDINHEMPKDGWLFCDRTHLTDKGQEIAAGIIKSTTLDDGADRSSAAGAGQSQTPEN